MKCLPQICRLLATTTALAAAPLHAEPPHQDIQLPAASVSPSLKELAASMAGMAAAPQARTVVPLRLVTPAMKNRARPAAVMGAAPDSALQTGGDAVTPDVHTNGTGINIEGIVSDVTVAPPDPNGAVGETQYLQAVNNRFAVYNKADGALLLGPIPNTALFAGLTGSPGADACRAGDITDPIAQYDKLAKRWLVTYVAWNPADLATGPYFQCIAVSTSSDATGSYYRYVLETRTNSGALALNDYPKVGVWPDAYVFTFVLFENAFGAYLGPQVCGLGRAAMLAGGATVARCFDLGDAYGAVLPSDLDGTMPPPAHSPNYLMSLDYNPDGTGDHLFLWRRSRSLVRTKAAAPASSNLHRASRSTRSATA
jgi:hypothetical protein